MTRLFSPEAVHLHASTTHVDTAITTRLDVGLVPGVTRPMAQPDANQSLAHLGPNLKVMGQSFSESLSQRLAWLNDLPAVPQKVAYNAATWIAGGHIEARTPYQAKLQNMPGPVDLAVNVVKGAAADSWATAQGVLSVADSALFTTVSRLGGIAPVTEEQLEHGLRLQAVGEAVTETAKLVSYNPFVHDPVGSASVGVMLAGMVTKKPRVSKDLGPLKTGTDFAQSSVVEKKGALTLMVEGKEVATFHKKSGVLEVADLALPKEPVNTMGVVLNARGLGGDVKKLVGPFDPTQKRAELAKEHWVQGKKEKAVYVQQSLIDYLKVDNKFGQDLFEFVGSHGALWSPSMLYGMNQALSSLAAPSLVSPYFIKNLKTNGQSTRGFGHFDVELQRLPEGTHPGEAYNAMARGELKISRGTQDVVTYLTQAMLRDTKRD